MFIRIYIYIYIYIYIRLPRGQESDEEYKRQESLQTVVDCCFSVDIKQQESLRHIAECCFNGEISNTLCIYHALSNMSGSWFPLVLFLHRLVSAGKPTQT